MNQTRLESPRHGSAEYWQAIASAREQARRDIAAQHERDRDAIAALRLWLLVSWAAVALMVVLGVMR